MPACATPELRPVWCSAGSDSRSRTTTRNDGRRRWSSRGVASPTIPAPTTTTSAAPGGPSVMPARVLGVKALVTGATGFVGGKLIGALERDGIEVRAFARNPSRVAADVPVVRGDAVTGEGLDEALSGVDVAYYLIHSMETSADDGLAGRELRSVENFVEAAARQGVRRAI